MQYSFSSAIQFLFKNNPTFDDVWLQKFDILCQELSEQELEKHLVNSFNTQMSTWIQKSSTKQIISILPSLSKVATSIGPQIRSICDSMLSLLVPLVLSQSEDPQLSTKESVLISKAVFAFTFSKKGQMVNAVKEILADISKKLVEFYVNYQSSNPRLCERSHEENQKAIEALSSFIGQFLIQCSQVDCVIDLDWLNQIASSMISIFKMYDRKPDNLSVSRLQQNLPALSKAVCHLLSVLAKIESTQALPFTSVASELINIGLSIDSQLLELLKDYSLIFGQSFVVSIQEKSFEKCLETEAFDAILLILTHGFLSQKQLLKVFTKVQDRKDEISLEIMVETAIKSNNLNLVDYSIRHVAALVNSKSSTRLVAKGLMLRLSEMIHPRYPLSALKSATITGDSTTTSSALETISKKRPADEILFSAPKVQLIAAPTTPNVSAITATASQVRPAAPTQVKPPKSTAPTQVKPTKATKVASSLAETETEEMPQIVLESSDEEE